MASQRIAFLLLILISMGVRNAMTDIIFVPKDLTVLVNGSVPFQLYYRNPINESVVVKLVVEFSDIVRTDPTEITLSATKTETIDIVVHGSLAGHTLILANASSPSISTSDAYVRVTSQHSSSIALVSVIVGWIYFVAWSVSFYPQMYENWRRKSVIGLNFDYLSLNLLGFILYALFNCGLFWIPVVQDEYSARHERSLNPVEPNDVFFSVHATIATFATVLQCVMYERGGQRVSIVARALLGLFLICLSITLFCSIFQVILWLDFLDICSYIKLTITLMKYFPQAFMNYRRKSTIGWSIGNIFLDFTGGSLSMLQMLLNAYNYNDWGSIFGDPSKFGLGLFSVMFDIFFLIQHYILYRNHQPYHFLSGYLTVDGANSPNVESEHGGEDSENTPHHYQSGGRT